MYNNQTMKKSLILVLIVIGLLFLRQQVSASGVSTSQTSSGVIVTTNPDGTTYLSTRVTDDVATASTTTAHPNTPLNQTQIAVPAGFATTFSGLLNGILSFVLVISALLVFGFLIWGGFDWITSGGDKGKTDKARQKIVSAIIGLIIVAASYAILQLVIHFLGFSSLNDVFQSTGTIQGGAASNTTGLTGLGALNATASATPQ